MDTEPRPSTPGETTGGEYAFSPKDLFRVVWKRLWVILLVSLTLLAAATGLSLNQTPMYQASTEILVGQDPQTDQSGMLSSNIMGLQELTPSMVEAINSNRVAEKVVRDLDLQVPPEAVLGNMSVEQVADTQFIEITYRDPDPERARQVANALGEATSEQTTEVAPANSFVTVAVWEPAETPVAPASPDPFRNGALALVLGLMLGLGLALLLEYLDDSWQSAEEVERVSGMPTFGVVPKFESRRKSKKRAGKKGSGY